TTCTVAPASMSRSTIRRPMPVLPPVTSATSPSRRNRSAIGRKVIANDIAGEYFTSWPRTPRSWGGYQLRDRSLVSCPEVQRQSRRLTVTEDPMRLSDRLAIQDLMTLYAMAVDGRDWRLYRSVFTPDAVIDYSDAGGFA